MTNLKHQLQRLYWKIVDHPFASIESILAVAIPLLIVVLMFQWRVRQSMKKQKRIQNRRDKVLKKLNKGGGGEGPEEEDEVVQEAIKLMEQKAKKVN